MKTLVNTALVPVVSIEEQRALVLSKATWGFVALVRHKQESGWTYKAQFITRWEALSLSNKYNSQVRVFEVRRGQVHLIWSK